MGREKVSENQIEGDGMKETIAEYIVPVTQDGKDVMFDFLRATRLTRCKDCKYYEVAERNYDGTPDKRCKPSVCTNGKYAVERPEDWYCGDAQRKEEDDD